MTGKSLARQIAKRLVLPIYQEADRAVTAHIAKASSEHKVTCSSEKACAGCCYQFVGSHLAEGLGLAHELQQRLTPGQLSELRLRLQAEVLRISDGHISRRDFFEGGTPCVFLEPGVESYTGRCSIYPVRPLACRIYYVCSPSEDCSPANPGRPVGQLDTTAVDVWAGEQFMQCSRELVRCMGPLQVVLDWAFRLIGGAEEIPEVEIRHWHDVLARWIVEDPSGRGAYKEPARFNEGVASSPPKA